MSVEDLRIESLATSFRTKTPQGVDWLVTTMQSAPTQTEIEERQLQLLQIRKKCRHNHAIATQIDQLQTSLVKDAAIIEARIANADIAEIKESESQVLFGTPVKNILITNDRFIDVTSTWKCKMLPFFTILIPLLAALAPFCLKSMGVSTPTMIDLFRDQVPSVLRRRALTQNLYIAGSMIAFISSLYTQWTSSQHVQHIHTDLVDQGASIRRAIQTLEILEPLLGFTHTPPHIPRTDLFYIYTYDVSKLTDLLQRIGRADAYIAISKLQVAFPRFSSDKFLIVDLYHPLLPPTQVRNTICNDTKSKSVLLTGPNRGGKSTFLKSVGIAVLWASTLGIVPAKSATIPWFGDQIHISLSQIDTVGAASLFEAEIDFAKSLLDVTESVAPCCIVMDEIFHSTNIADSTIATNAFLSQLYRRPTVWSFISTHNADVVRDLTQAQAYCMDAKIDADGIITYLYKYCRGVNTISSVNEILKEKQLIPASH